MLVFANTTKNQTKKKTGDMSKLIPLLLVDRFTDGTFTIPKDTRAHQITKLTVTVMICD